ncbi:MAG: NAD(P)/FAD-dependent oxidoreductase [Mollicutes bacterium]|nr:NAD(P)/FAD-dependent oxidoreductase [Mollicutes bacterium]MDD7264456.1 FAD-dependent oxidoreductase [bacterium]MDY4979400.1 FAD-dependent oxidoreductase [Candidatus Onthovivens sp.]
MENFDIIVIGGGPGGLAASIKASENTKVLLIERENKLGGILKQCIHDGFGVTKFKEKLSGPEYANREIEKLKKTNVTVLKNTFVTNITSENNEVIVTFANENGVNKAKGKKLILATGCRERTSKQISIHGTNPTGVMTAGQAQYYINILGKMPCKEVVILGSGDIGLIMARRLTLEGAHVKGVYEVKSTPSGLSRNIAQCLTDFNIPLYLSHTVTRVFGKDRLEAIEVAKVDNKMNPIKGSEEIIKCDSLILSVGLIPENELAKEINVPLNRFTKGPDVDQTFETLVNNVYSCGNAMHVNDLADYVSESGEIAANDASKLLNNKRDLKPVKFDSHFGYVVPSFIDFHKSTEKMTFYFRARDEYKDKTLLIKQKGEVLLKRRYSHLRPPEMEKILLTVKNNDEIEFILEDTK